jgi:hypothetical protein
VPDNPLEDRRGGRLAFPACVVREELRLRAFSGRRRFELEPEGFWATLWRNGGLGPGGVTPGFSTSAAP